MKISKSQSEEIKNSVAWRYICDEINYRIECSLNDLRSCSTDKLIEVQKRIQVLEEITKMPDVAIEREQNELKQEISNG